MADVDLFVIQKEWTNLGNKKMLTWKKSKYAQCRPNQID
jgi:hypothetical protein